jgi:hypothetical protein
MQFEIMVVAIHDLVTKNLSLIHDLAYEEGDKIHFQK